MAGKRRQMAGGRGHVLAPGEQLLAAAPAEEAEWMWLIVSLVEVIALALLQRARGYLVTERRVYVHLCRVSSPRNHHLEEVLARRRLGEARVEFRLNRLTLDRRHPVYVGWLTLGQVLGAPGRRKPQRRLSPGCPLG